MFPKIPCAFFKKKKTRAERGHWKNLFLKTVSLKNPNPISFRQPKLLFLGAEDDSINDENFISLKIDEGPLPYQDTDSIGSLFFSLTAQPT